MSSHQTSQYCRFHEFYMGKTIINTSTTQKVSKASVFHRYGGDSEKLFRLEPEYTVITNSKFKPI